MKTLRRPTLAILFAIVSTAALGPGTTFMQEPGAAGKRSLHAARQNAPTLPELEAAMHSVFAGMPSASAVALLADAPMDAADFLAIDFAQARADGNGTGPRVVGGAPILVAAGSGEAPHAEYASAAAGATGAPARGTQLARSSGLQAAATGPLSGVSAGPSAINLDDAAIVDGDIQQVPLLALSPAPGDFQAGARDGSSAAGAATAVPEPATALLTGLGLLGLLAAGRNRRATV